MKQKSLEEIENLAVAQAMESSAAVELLRTVATDSARAMYEGLLREGYIRVNTETKAEPEPEPELDFPEADVVLQAIGAMIGAAMSNKSDPLSVISSLLKGKPDA